MVLVRQIDNGEVIERGTTICINNKFIKSNNDIYKIDLENESYTYYKKTWYQQDRQGCFYKM
ncbi:hypothetical protein BSYN_13830 [Bacteroides sedimenti]|uniref:Uncharacterized protein n=1 Tax=Bacteroides sedimenti TaxID=2136147 RepID=A0ABM8IAS5_9BACE